MFDILDLNDTYKDDTDVDVRFDKKDVIIETFNHYVIENPIKYDFKSGEVIFVIEDNLRKRVVVDNKSDDGLTGIRIDESLCCDIYIYNDENFEFEPVLKRWDPEEVLENGGLEEGNIVMLTKCNTLDPFVISDTDFVDPTGIYMITESMNGYIDEYNNICDSRNETYVDDEEDEEEDEVEESETLMFIPIKSFFYYLKDKKNIIDVAKKIYSKVESGEDIHISENWK